MKKAIALIAIISCALSACNQPKDGRAAATETTTKAAEQPATDEMYTCTMHLEVMGDKPGKCPKCGMNLTKQKMTAEQMTMMKEGTFAKPKE